MASTALDYINLPIVQNLANEDIRMINERMIIGLIDGFILKIQRPNHAADAFYCGRPGKCYDGLNIQYMTDFQGKIRHIVTGISGRAHDRNAIEWCRRFRLWLDALPDNYFVLGDSAYVGFHPKLLTIHRNPQNNAQRDFNREARLLRVSIENVIGANECIWRLIMSKENRLPTKSGINLSCNIVISAAVLHNRFTNYVRP